MGRKRKKELCVTPFCYYCLREFNSNDELLAHQRSKHFKCMECYKKLSSTYALVSHTLQMHKKQLAVIPNGTAHDDVLYDICGMNNVPQQLIQQHIQQLKIKQGIIDEQNDTNISTTSTATTEPTAQLLPVPVVPQYQPLQQLPEYNKPNMQQQRQAVPPVQHQVPPYVHQQHQSAYYQAPFVAQPNYAYNYIQSQPSTIQSNVPLNNSVAQVQQMSTLPSHLQHLLPVQPSPLSASDTSPSPPTINSNASLQPAIPSIHTNTEQSHSQPSIPSTPTNITLTPHTSPYNRSSVTNHTNTTDKIRYMFTGDLSTSPEEMRAMKYQSPNKLIQVQSNVDEIT